MFCFEFANFALLFGMLLLAFVVFGFSWLFWFCVLSVCLCCWWWLWVVCSCGFGLVDDVNGALVGF